MSETVSSAIALAEDAHEFPTGTNGLKRRQSDALEQNQEQENKRQRTTPGKNSPITASDGGNGTQPRAVSDNASKPAQKEDTRGIARKNGVGDEKQRSKRLFGALLGNLNQPGDRVSKRRSEIEQRRKAELQKQDDERLEDRQRRLERLAFQRKKEQIKVDEQNVWPPPKALGVRWETTTDLRDQMHARHRNILDAANFLHTRTEPKLHYRPWELLPDEEDRIDDQIKDAQAQVDQEVVEWEEAKRKRMDELDEPQSNGKTDEAPGADADDPGFSKEGTSGTSIGPLEGDKNGNADKQIATNIDETSKAAEVPGSDSVMTEAGDTQPGPLLNPLEGDANGVAAETTGGVAKEESGQGAEDDAEDEGDHVVEGDEDTVIY